MPFNAITIDETKAVEDMVARTLLQFRQSPVFLDVLNAFSLEVQRLQTAILDVQRKRMAAIATHEQLDALGRIVGQGRFMPGFSASAYWTPDEPTLGKMDDPAAPVWVETAPIYSDTVNDDLTLRRFIECKIKKNHTRYGSIPELQATVKAALGFDISVIRTNPMEIYVVVPNGTTLDDKTALGKMLDSMYVDQAGFIPIAATVSILDVLEVSEVPT